MNIKDLCVEYQKEPIGLDEKTPRFSWKLESKKQNSFQKAYQIQVSKEGECCWNSGRKEDSESRGVEYDGKELEPCTRYNVEITIWGNYDEQVQACTVFETGLMDESQKAWEGARWIGAPRHNVCASALGVFVIETEFRIAKDGKRAGIVFGANDERLLEASRNELGIEGENYIRYEISIEQPIPKLEIFRVGYAVEDKPDVPFASIPIENFVGENKQPIITKENMYEFHAIKIEVDGNNALTYIDNVLVDGMWKTEMDETKLAGRMLNPRGRNDVITYPKLNEVGFYAAEGTRAYFKCLKVKNLRTPEAVVVCETPEGNICGNKSIFESLLSKQDDCFYIEDRQVTANPSHTAIPMLRTVVRVEEEKKLVCARLYITARGIYECKVNGQMLTKRVLLPGLTQYDKRINYQTYDILPYVEKGMNGLGVILSSGWWSDSQTFCVKNYNYFGDKESVLAKVVLTYEDGIKQTVLTDTTNWKYFGDGPYRYAGFFQGEHVDANKMAIYEEYSKGDFDDSKWERPIEIKTTPIAKHYAMPKSFTRPWPAVNQSEPAIIGEYEAPVYIVATRQAKSRKKINETTYIYDLEQEMAGVPRITFDEKKGTKITIRYAEVLYPNLPEYKGREGTLLLENYRDAGSTDVYICSGKVETYQPKFTWHGYRYIEIAGVTKPPKLEAVESLQYSSITDFTGQFESSNQLLNRFVQNVYWSQKCNFINIPTDCPQRNERMGWAGDTHVFCNTALQNSDLKLFYERNLKAMSDLQTVEGRFPEIAPIGGAWGGITYECATIFIAWELYQQYGDIQTLRKFYPGIKKYMDYMATKGLPGVGEEITIGPLGDWLAVEETDNQLLWNAFYYREVVMMKKITMILDEKEVEKYEKLSDEIKRFWNDTFVDCKMGTTKTIAGEICDTQTSYAIGLEYGLFENRALAEKNLLRKVKESDYKITTGFFGTGLINPALSKAGFTSDAYKLMLQTELPSWLYPVTQGATTIWERWNSYTHEEGFGGQNEMNSFNHYSLGSVLSWIYNTILGIKQDEKFPGYKHFILKPTVEVLEFARGQIASPYGAIKSEWASKNGEVVYSCELPVNCSATVYLGDGEKKEVGSGRHIFYWTAV